MTIVVGTAGHIDHGKTTLLRALTGIDADRLPEERARGMTIDVGYAHMALVDGTEIDFVDVPGHDRLVGNMLVGAGEIDAALLVIAADDGPRAQTREHLELLDALRVSDGLIVVTKVDVVDDDRVAEVVAAARALVALTSLRDVPVLAASATTGVGLDAVARALTELRDRIVRQLADSVTVSVASVTGEPAIAATRLAIDRVFTIRGRGTVVTGTLRGAQIERGAILRVVPGAAGLRVRVREVQVHGRTVDRAGPGRVALNIAGDGIDGLDRGTELTTDPGVVATDRLLVALRPVATLDGRAIGAVAGTGTGGSRRAPGSVPADRTPISVHVGTARGSGIVARTGRDDVDLGGGDLGGGERSAVLRLDRVMAIAAGDRFVVRRASPVENLGGGRVLDPQPARGVARRRTSPERIVVLAHAEAGSAAWHSARLDLHGALGGGSPALAPDVSAAVDGALLAAVEAQPGVRIAELIRAGESALRRAVVLGQAGRGAAASPADPARRLVSGRIDDLVEMGRLRRDLDRLRLPGLSPAAPDPAVLAAMDRLVAALASTSPPSLAAAAREAGCPPDGVRWLEAARRIVRLEDDLAWAEPTWRALASRALELARGGPLTPAAFRDATGSSRKYVMALLEDLDRRAILRRTDAGHVPGPRAGVLAHAGDPSPAGAAPASGAGAAPASGARAGR